MEVTSKMTARDVKAGWGKKQKHYECVLHHCLHRDNQNNDPTHAGKMLYSTIFMIICILKGKKVRIYNKWCTIPLFLEFLLRVVCTVHYMEIQVLMASSSFFFWSLGARSYDLQWPLSEGEKRQEINRGLELSNS